MRFFFFFKAIEHLKPFLQQFPMEKISSPWKGSVFFFVFFKLSPTICTIHPHSLYSVGGGGRRGMGRDRQQEAVHEEFHFAAFQLNPPVSLGQAGASRHALGWPPALNISDTLMVEADRDVCLVSFRKRIVFRLSVHLPAVLLQSADCSIRLPGLRVWLLRSSWDVNGWVQLCEAEAWRELTLLLSVTHCN